MRVGMISPYSLTVPGGVQGQILGLARSLRELGIDTRVLGPCDGPPPDAGVTPLGNSLPTASNGSVAPIAPDPSAQLRVIRALRDEAFDVLHLHEPMVPGPTMTALVLKQAPIVATFHRAGESRSYQTFGRGLRWLRARIEVSVAVSEEAAALARGQLGGHYDVLFNGVEVARYREIAAVKAPQRTILFVGRHEPRKGLGVLLSTLPDLPPDIRIWVASDGPQTAELTSMWAGDPRIEWLGRISEHEKVARMKAATVFCAPSLGGESFGVVLLEAMAAETAIVASALDGYAKVARSGVDALLTPPGDVAALGAALRQVLDDEALATRLVASGRARAEEFSMRRLAEAYLARYRQALGAAPVTSLA